MGIEMVGLNHETAPVEVRERFVFSESEAREALAGLTSTGALREAVLLSTCNRTELYGYAGEGGGAGGAGGARAAAGAGEAGQSGGAGGAEGGIARARSVLAARAGMSTAEADAYLYRRTGPDAVRHLYRVTSSLDSMVLGEAQIQGQVREAYEAARSLRSTRVVGPVLSRLFESALSVGGRVRTETRLGTGAASVPSAAVELARKIFGNLRGHRALILGAGQMSELALECLAGDGVDNVVVANRTALRAEALAGKVGGRSAGYEDLPRLLREADIVISATAAPHYMLTRRIMDEAFPRGREDPLLVVDLALPRDVEPVVGDVRGVFLYGIDDLRQIVEANRARRENQVPDAEAIIDGAVGEYWLWYASLDAVPVLRAMRARAERLRTGEVEKAMRRLGHLSEEDRAIVEALSVQLMNKLLHEPTVRLKEGAGNGHPVIAEAARYLFDLSGGEDDLETEGG